MTWQLLEPSGMELSLVSQVLWVQLDPIGILLPGLVHLPPGHDGRLGLLLLPGFDHLSLGHDGQTRCLGHVPPSAVKLQRYHLAWGSPLC